MVMILQPLAREAVLQPGWWRSSPPVPVLARPVVDREAREPGLSEAELATFWAALDAIPNVDVEYDLYRNYAYSAHWATGGSQEGLERFEAWAARSAKHVPGFTEAKIWDYASESRAGGITAATVFGMAAKAGWVNPATHGEPDDEGFVVEGAAAVALAEPTVADGVENTRRVAVVDTIAGTIKVVRARPDTWEQPTYAREKKTGVVIASVENAVKAIRDEWEVGMRVAHDTFRDEIMVAPAGTENQWRNITDADIVRLRIKLEQKRFKSAPKELARDAMVLVADENQFDSARLWLDSVQTCWDGVRRVDTFLRDFFGCADTPYTRAVSRYIWTAMAGRVIQPGCQADMAPILEGDQGLRKTSALAAMVPDRMFFTEIDLSKDDDTLARLLRGSLVGEISELRGLQTKDQESIKAWISRRYEKWVPKFKEFSTVFPRRCVLFGTTNRTDLLVDETGNRRWLPVHVTRADVEGIDAVREQLWAEGAALFDGLVPGWGGGVAWKDAEELARAEHEGYRRTDEWEAPIQAWLDGNDALDDAGGASAGAARGESPFAVLDVLCGALGMSVKEVDMKAQTRCGAVLRSLGFEKKDVRVRGAIGKRWVRRV